MVAGAPPDKMFSRATGATALLATVSWYENGERLDIQNMHCEPEVPDSSLAELLKRQPGRASP